MRLRGLATRAATEARPTSRRRNASEPTREARVVRVTLIRHAEAGDDAPRDEARALTTRGRADARRLGRALARRRVRFTAIVTSPLVRAVQTAEIVAAATDYRGRMLATDQLQPEASPGDVVHLLATLAREGETSVALVAHEPILSALAAALTGKARHPALRKAEALRIRLAAGAATPGSLRWRIDGGTGKRERLH
jgi:phosphohistidine phosphatase